METKIPHNEKYQPHGDWVIYCGKILYCKGTFDNGNKIGLWEWFDLNGNLDISHFYID